MSDLEFQRELSPEQMREALSLLAGTAGAQAQNSQIADLNPAEEVGPEADQSGTTIAAQDRPTPPEHPRPPKKPVNSAIAYYGLGIAAAGALALLSWWQSALTPPPLAKVAHQELPNRPAVTPGIIASPAPPIATATPEAADSGATGHAGGDDDHGAVRDRAYSEGPMPYAAGPDTVSAMTAREAQWDEKASRKPGPARWHTRAVRFATAKKRSYRQARAEISRNTCFFLCLSWPAHRTFSYEPPRSMTQ